MHPPWEDESDYKIYYITPGYVLSKTLVEPNIGQIRSTPSLMKRRLRAVGARSNQLTKEQALTLLKN